MANERAWSDEAVADFIDSLLQVREEDLRKKADEGTNGGVISPSFPSYFPDFVPEST